MKQSKEWEMVGDLIDLTCDMNDTEADFIQDLHENLDPYGDVREELSTKQIDYLICIHDKYCNDNEDAFEDFE